MTEIIQESKMGLFDVYPLLPVAIDYGRGSVVFDKEGRKYLDLYGGHAVLSIGHSHPHYIWRITQQLEKIGFYSNSLEIPIQEELAEKLGKVSGKTTYNLFLCSSGAEANENALKVAAFHNGRSKIVSFRRGFHGRTSLALAITDNANIRSAANTHDNVTFLPYNDVQALEDHFKKEGDQISSVIVEGIQGLGGIYEATDEFLQAIRRLCDQYGAIYIADSVQCGYGRTGIFYAHDAAGVSADIYTMAKGMGNGFPIGGVAIAPHLKAKHGMLGHTYGGNHLSCAAALAVLEVMEAENTMQNAKDIGQIFIDGLHKLGRYKIRGRGLMIGIDLGSDHRAIRNALIFDKSIFTGESSPNIIRLLPAMNLTKEGALWFLEAFEDVVENLPQA